MKITGKVVRKNIAGGFWGIIDENGQEWRPLNLPKSLQNDGKIVTINAKLAKEEMSIFMWGTAIEIIWVL
ncbi:MAG: hypothetical protein HC803_04965 [Saprospiraceae bacterium]|nr:hypothetical protein [Saprospiraceae bacterium]